MKKLNKKDIEVLITLIARYYRFHKGEEFNKINCWGLMKWGDISSTLKKGIIKTDYNKSNKICWFAPTEETIKNYIKPFVDKLNTKTLGDPFDFENFEVKCGIILADMASKVYSINQLKEYIIKDTDFLDVSKKNKDFDNFEKTFMYALNETLDEVSQDIEVYCLDKKYQDISWLKTEKFLFNMDEIYRYFVSKVNEYEKEN